MRARAAALLSLVLLLAAAWVGLPGCSTPGAAGAAKEPAAEASEGGSARAKALAAAKVRAAREAAEAREPGERGSFDFGNGPIARSRRRAAESAESAETAGTEDAGPADARVRRRDEPPDLSDPSPVPAALRGIRITWEALAVEREQVENPRFGRRPLKGAAPELKTVLVSQSHPAAQDRQKGRAAAREGDGTQVAVLPDEDLQVLVRGLRQSGFFAVARPTGGLAPQFEDREARGRVTVEVDGQSLTVLSMRGQGGASGTKDIPRVYSEAKQAIALVRNNTPTLNVSTAGGTNGRPTMRPRKRGASRVLTDEEAAKALGGELPPGKADDDWGLGR